ncbi:ArsR family transcriptional regulator [Bacillus cereus]
MDIEVLNTMEENEFLSPGRKERYIKDFSAAKDSLERITIYAKFMLEAKERKEELEDDSNTLGIR